MKKIFLFILLLLLSGCTFNLEDFLDEEDDETVQEIPVDEENPNEELTPTQEDIDLSLAVITLINSIPNEVTLDDETLLISIRTAYDALTLNQKALVQLGVYQILVNAEQAIFNFKNPDIQEIQAIIINHNHIDLLSIPNNYIESAKSTLNIAYGHTSHGSQIISGLEGLASFKGSLYDYNDLVLADMPFDNAYDLGNPDLTSWASETDTYLSTHTDVNVIMWSWCGQVSSSTETDITNYLSLMNNLEIKYPDVYFVYMTGHLDGTGLLGNLNLRNEQIRRYCIENNKILYDFADIESYDPDGVYYLDKYANDNCDYDSNSDSDPDTNWALDWQSSHTEGVDWYSCDVAHSQSINGNMKAYAFWYLLASLIGFNDN